MRKEFKRVGPLSFGLIYAMVTLLLGILFGVLALVFGPSFLEMASQGQPLPPEATEIFNPAFIAIGIGIYTVIAFIFGIITALIYNLAAAIVGGVQYTIRDLD